MSSMTEPNTDPQDSEYSYRNLFDAMAASFWELDFSEVRQMLRDLRKSGVADPESYFAGNPDFVRAMMAATRVVNVNERTVKLFGRGSKAEMFGDLERFWPSESTSVFAGSVVAILSGKPHFFAETKLRKLDGSVFDVEFTVCFPPEGAAASIMLIGIIDLTERNQAIISLEETSARYRTFFNVSAVSFWQLDVSGVNILFNELRAQGVTDLSAYIDVHPEFITRAMDLTKVVDVNDKTITMFGGRDRSEFLGRSIRRDWIPGRYEAYRNSIQAGFRGESGYQTETRLRTLDGREIDTLFCMAAPPEIRARGVVFVAHIDISAQVAARTAIAQMQAELAHAARLSMLGELTASIAHEVNQPLAAIVTNGEAGLLWLDRPEPDTAEVRKSIERMIADGRRAADIIRRIRGMAVKRAPEMVPQSLNTVVAGSELFLRHELQARRVQVLLSLAPHLPDVVIDRIQIQQVIANLIVNAVQAMSDVESEYPTLTISTRRHDAKTALVTVDDNGPGIAPNQLEQIFDSFFTTKATGMGMGLPICRSIVEAHGGAIEAQNRPEAGARFVVTLPVIA
jgi:signal transduction histidine kinase